MGNIIQKELRIAKTKMFEEVTYNNKKLVKLTTDNVAIVEAMIRNDSAYIKSTDISAGPKFDRKNQLVYGGSSAYWMTMLKSVLIKNKEVNAYGAVSVAIVGSILIIAGLIISVILKLT